MLGVGVFAAMVLLSQFEVQERFFGNHHEHPYDATSEAGEVAGDAEHQVTTGIYTSRDGVVHDGHAEARERAATDRPPVKSAREVYLELRKQEEAKQAEAMSKQAEATAMALRVEEAKLAAEREAAAKVAATKDVPASDATSRETYLNDGALGGAALNGAALGGAPNTTPTAATGSKPGTNATGSKPGSNTSGIGTAGTTPDNLIAMSTVPTAVPTTVSTTVSTTVPTDMYASSQSAVTSGASLRNTLPGSKFVSMAQSRGVNVPLADDAVSSTVTRFYGATFVADPKLKLPAKAMFEKPADSRAYQKTIPIKRFYMGGYKVSLQAPAADALIAAQKEASATHLKITPVGDVASLRSYEDTSYIWHKYLDKGLAYWVSRKKITPAQARAILASPPKKQLSQVIALEQKGLYLHANHAHSILNLAAPPGSSQHISGLALDIEEHQNANVRAILNRHGWYQTVAHDFPHFIYLGRPVNELPQLGLTSIKSDGRQFWVPDVPDNLPPTLR